VEVLERKARGARIEDFLPEITIFWRKPLRIAERRQSKLATRERTRRRGKKGRDLLDDEDERASEPTQNM
jgi:hypothetical protein